MKIAQAQKIFRELNVQQAQHFEFIRRVCADPELARKWMNRENDLSNMREIHEALENISWEKKHDEIYSLCSDAEDEVRELIEECNRYRTGFGIELEESDI